MAVLAVLGQSTGVASLEADRTLDRFAVALGAVEVGVGLFEQETGDRVLLWRDVDLATAEKLGCPGVVKREDVEANTDYVGEGYGIPTPECLKAIEMFARLEGLLLDPVYSGKAAAGLIDLVKKGAFSDDQNIVFLHTGGAVALFGYTDAFGYGAPGSEAAE